MIKLIYLMLRKEEKTYSTHQWWPILWLYGFTNKRGDKTVTLRDGIFNIFSVLLSYYTCIENWSELYSHYVQTFCSRLFNITNIFSMAISLLPFTNYRISQFLGSQWFNSIQMIWCAQPFLTRILFQIGLAQKL